METLVKEHSFVISKSAGILLKKHMLTAIAWSILKNPMHQEELKSILEEVGITEIEAVNAYVEYDLDIYSYGNEIYSDLAIRFALHMHNLLENSWHYEGQRTIIDYINKVNPSNMIDMGFGSPSGYVRHFLKHPSVKITLCDVFDAAFDFAEKLLRRWKSTWQNTISFNQLDMNSNAFVGNYDVYLFQDSIEHVEDSKGYLSKYVNSSPAHAHFILSLPIGPIVPVHYITWHTPETAFHWLENCGLSIVESRLIPVNPEVDLFAEQLNFEYKTLMVLCTKK